MKTKSVLFSILFVVFYTALFAQIPDWQWTTQAGGNGGDRGYAIATDDNGNSFVTGLFSETATFGSHSLTSSGSCDIFVAKMDINGNWLWASKAGGSGGNSGYGIALDDNGNSYITGAFKDTATFGSYSLTSSGGYDIFIAKMDATGNWQWVAKAGGNDWDQGNSIAIDNNGNSYVTGRFRETATFSSYTLTSSGFNDIFVAKMDATGNWLWAAQVGGSDWDEGRGIAIDDNGNSYVTGSFMDTATFGSSSLISSGGRDVFVAKMDASGNWLWSTNAGGSDSEFCLGIAIDDNGNSYVTGYFWGIATFGSSSLISSGGHDVFVAKMDTTGNWLWAAQAGGSDSDDFIFDIATDDNGNSFVTGLFSETATFGSYSLTSNGDDDIFVAKMGNNTSVENDTIPTKMVLSNYPNPFNPSTTIEFSIQNNSKIELTIYNIKGQKIKTLADNEFAYGFHSIIWNGYDDNNNPVSSGIYYYKLCVNGTTEAVKKCLLLK